MSTYSTLQCERDADSTMVVGKQDHQDVEPKISRFTFPQSEDKSVPSAAPVDPTPARDCNSLDPEVATETLVSFLPRVPSEAAGKSSNAVATRLTLNVAKETDALSLENFDESIQPQPQNPFPDTSNANEDDIRHGDSRARTLGLSQGDDTTTSDDGNISSTESDGENEYDLMARVEGRAGQFLTSLDTQAHKSFIDRSTLARLGGVKEYSVPKAKAKAYHSPLAPTESTMVTKFVDLGLHLYHRNIDEYLEARLHVLEVWGAHNGFQLLLGRDSIRQLGGWRFLRRVEEANADGPNSVVSVDKSFAAALRPTKKKSKKQVEDDRAKDRAMQENQRREHAELYRNGYTTPPLSTGSSMQSPCTSTSSHWGVSQPTGYYLPGPDCGQPAARQSKQLPETPYWPIQRAETSSTWDTQHTQYSLNRQDTASSASSWPSSVQAYAPKEGAPPLEALAPETAMGVVSSEEEKECE